MPRFYETTLSITNLHNLSISTHVNRSRINKYIHDFKSEDNKLRSEILEEMNRLILINREE